MGKKKHSASKLWTIPIFTFKWIVYRRKKRKNINKKDIKMSLSLTFNQTFCIISTHTHTHIDNYIVVYRKKHVCLESLNNTYSLHLQSSSFAMVGMKMMVSATPSNSPPFPTACHSPTEPVIREPDFYTQLHILNSQKFLSIFQLSFLLRF